MGHARAVRWALVVLPSLAVLATIPSDLLPWLRGPAPYPPEWQWGFRAEGPARPLWAAGGLAALLLALLAASGGAWAARRQRAAAAGLLAGAVALGSLLTLALLFREPAGPLRTLMYRAMSRSFTSYYTVAISEDARDPREFLRRHAELLPKLAGYAKHAATHPPGPVLFYVAMIRACELSPGLREALLHAASVSEHDFSPPTTRAARGGALLADLVLVLCGALVAWPLARLGEALGLGPLPAARLALLWALVPGASLMTPQLDQALALPVVVSALLLLRAGGSAPMRALAGRAALAGACGGLAILLSYGSLAFLAIAGLAVLAAAWPTAARLRRTVTAGAMATVAAALVAFVLPALLGHEPLRALRTALAIHREAYTAPRSYALWLAFDPLDLALFLGLPVAALALGHAVSAARRGLAGAPLDPVERFGLAVVAGVAALVLLGVTRGEVGRIWIPLMPLLLVSGMAREDVPSTVVVGALLAGFDLAMAGFWAV